MGDVLGKTVEVLAYALVDRLQGLEAGNPRRRVDADTLGVETADRATAAVAPVAAVPAFVW